MPKGEEAEVVGKSNQIGPCAAQSGLNPDVDFPSKS